MQYRKLRADKIFDGFNWLEEGTVLILQETGEIIDIVSGNEAGQEIEDLHGILVPGLINCHCHLELSHLKNTIAPHSGLVNFLLTVIKTRAVDQEKIFAAVSAAEEEMYSNGVVAVADICNTGHAIPIKKTSEIYWHNLIEVISLRDDNLEKQLSYFNSVLEQYKMQTKHYATFTPHAPYSVSPACFNALNKLTANSIISIHNQETSAENDLFQNGNGEFLKLFAALGEQEIPFEKSEKTSLQTWLPYFTNGQTIILVHNTFISEEDIVFAKAHSEKYGLKLIYCLCPNANLYIENRLPPVELMIKHNCKIVLGTDSYSSNRQLSIASEIKTLNDHFPQLSLQTILQWATSNGAEALHFSSLASFEKGKKPGVVLLESDPMNKHSITGKSLRII